MSRTITTTIIVTADTRIAAMAEGEIAARATRPEAVAVKAVKDVTTKAERWIFAAHPERTRWQVTVEFSLREDMIRQFGDEGRAAADALGL